MLLKKCTQGFTFAPYIHLLILLVLFTYYNEPLWRDGRQNNKSVLKYFLGYKPTMHTAKVYITWFLNSISPRIWSDINMLNQWGVCYCFLFFVLLIHVNTIFFWSGTFPLDSKKKSTKFALRLVSKRSAYHFLVYQLNQHFI